MVLLGIIILVALLIPIVSIVADSPIGKAVGRRIEGPEPIAPDVALLGKKVDLLESEVDDLTRLVQSLQEETAFLQKLVEDAPSRPRLPPPSAP